MEKRILRGEVWFADFEPVRGHEQGGQRPCMVISVDEFNNSPAELATVLPITSRGRNIPTRINVMPPEGGLKQQSYIQCEMVRTISTARLTKRLGMVSVETIRAIEEELRILFGL